MVLVVKNPPANAEDVRDQVQSLSWEDPLGEGMATHASTFAYGDPRQYLCLENPMDRGTWRAIVHGVVKSWTRLK